MITNLKVDIIYYKTSSDFELEFNLSGCCRMRILKDSVDSKRELFSALARDVARSRIIIMVSDLIGDKNGVQALCSAIGYEYTPINKAEYSIKSGDNISIPRGGLPLVTKSGQYGGCIVECGSQSIIVVSSDRVLRHEIMRSYIHQYIFDINQVEAYNERIKHENSNNPAIDNSNILSTARSDKYTVVTLPDTPDDSVTVDGGEGVVLPKNLQENPPTEPEKADKTEEPIVEAEADSSEIYRSNVSDTSPAEEDTTSAEHQNDEICEDNKEITDNTDFGEPVSKNETSEERLEAFQNISSDTDGFSVTQELNLTRDVENSSNKRIYRRRKGGNIALLIIAILLLVCFGVLAYYLVYLPIISGEMPNSITKILEELL